MSSKAGTVLGIVAATVLPIASTALYADSVPYATRLSTTVHYVSSGPLRR
jgi:hypothetical protein